MEKKLLNWMLTGETGLSSKAMARAFMDLKGRTDHPYDPDDLNRCLLLLDAVPEARQHMNKINGDKMDNRICNLRDVETAINCQNRRQARAGNKSGVLGASWHRRFGKWAAQIRVAGKSKHIGYFDTPEEAGRAYLEAKRTNHPGCTI